jgi:hypothetical protein
LVSPKPVCGLEQNKAENEQMSEERPPKQRHTHPPTWQMLSTSGYMVYNLQQNRQIAEERGEEKRAEDGDKKKNVSN